MAGTTRLLAAAVRQVSQIVHASSDVHSQRGPSMHFESIEKEYGFSGSHTIYPRLNYSVRIAVQPAVVTANRVQGTMLPDMRL